MPSHDSAAISDAAAFAGYERGAREYRRILLALLFSGVATFAQLYSFQGVLPLVARGLRVDPSSAALTISVATIALAVGVLPWSWAADRFGRLPAMRASLVLAVVAGFAVTLMPSLGGILVLRAVEGFALGGVPAIAVTYLQEEISKKSVAIAAGTYVSGTTIGGLLGRIVAAPVGDAFGWRAGVLAVVGVTALAVVLFMVLTPVPRGFRRIAPEDRVSVPRTVMMHLRNPRLLVIYAQGFLLMGAFVAVYNYLSFRLEGRPFGLNPSTSALLFLAYLAGTVSSRVAGSLVGRFTRHVVLITSIAVMIAGVLITLSDLLWLVVVGLVVMTTGFFGAHSIASGWGAVRATSGRAQATSLYNLFYYTGSSVLGWGAGLLFVATGWGGVVAMVVVLAVVAGACAAWDARAVRRATAGGSAGV